MAGPRAGPGRLLRAAGRFALPLVVAAAAVGVAARSTVSPHVARLLPWLLAALVGVVGAATAVPSRRQAVAGVRTAARAVVLGGIGLPLVAWCASRLVTGPARLGTLALGFAPAEIASAATVALAGGSTVSAIIVLVASVVVTAGVVGPGLGYLAGQSVSGAPLALSLGLQVLVPLAAGLFVGPAVRRRVGGPALNGLAIVIVAALVGLVASEVVIGTDLPRLVAVAAVVVAGGYAVGALAGLGLRRPDRTAVLLTCGMRDFAIGAAIANAAFGAATTAPAVPYGVIVLASGTAVATVTRRRASAKRRRRPK